jgi:hypothetical protein
MRNNNSFCQNIGCRVTSCSYNEDGCHCSLDAIEVAPCSGCHSGKKEDESNCASYKAK